jgi:hypothetical protein
MDDDGGRWRVLQLEATDTAPLASRDGHHQVVPIHHHRGPGWAGQLGVSALVFERPGYRSAPPSGRSLLASGVPAPLHRHRALAAQQEVS